MNTSEVQIMVAKFLAERGHEHICENFGHRRFEMDVASLSKSSMLHEIEVKISRADFLKDRQKKGKSGMSKLDGYKSGKDNWATPNYFYYACPEDLIKKEEIPHWAGLYYCSTDGVRIIQGPKRLHNEPQDREAVLKKMLRMTVQRKYLGGCLMTVINNRAKEQYQKWQTENSDAQSVTVERSVATTDAPITPSD